MFVTELLRVIVWASCWFFLRCSRFPGVSKISPVWSWSLSALTPPSESGLPCLCWEQKSSCVFYIQVIAPGQIVACLDHRRNSLLRKPQAPWLFSSLPWRSLTLHLFLFRSQGQRAGKIGHLPVQWAVHDLSKHWVPTATLKSRNHWLSMSLTQAIAWMTLGETMEPNWSLMYYCRSPLLISTH